MKRPVLYVCFVFIGFLTIAQSAIKKELYQSARKSFARGSYVSALQNFSEFKGANEEYLKVHPELSNAIGSAIRICEEKIAESAQKEEQPQPGLRKTSIQISAKVDEPGPVYLLPTESVISREVKRELKGYLQALGEKPFAGIRFTCLTNISKDSLEQYDYAMSRIQLFNDFFEEEGIPANRIEWEVANIAEDAYRFNYCIRIDNPAKGSLCLDPRLIRQMEIFDLEP